MFIGQKVIHQSTGEEGIIVDGPIYDREAKRNFYKLEPEDVFWEDVSEDEITPKEE